MKLTKWRDYLTEQEQQQNLALYVKDEEYEIRFVLYDPVLFLNKIKDFASETQKPFFLINHGITISMIVANKQSDVGPCYNAAEVVRSATSSKYKGKKYGSLLYHILMSVFAPKPITGDRSGTSASAQKVYDKLPATTKDFDNVMDPKTPPPEDDCYISDKTINKAYYIDPSKISHYKSLFQTFQNNHNKITEKMPNAGQKFEDVLISASNMLFGYEYSG